MKAPSSIAGPRLNLSTDTAQQEQVPTVVSQMHEVTTGSSMPPVVQTDPAPKVRAGVTVYFLGGEQNLLYVEVNGQWAEYVKSTRQRNLNGETTLSRAQMPARRPVHWAGYTCRSPYEITQERKRRIYYDPRARPDLFPALDGQPPTLPLPVLELTGDPEDPAPWLDPDTGERFSSEPASLILRLLRYCPRKPFTTPAVCLFAARSRGGSSLAE
ncbi:MAG TPA: hypothetical protein VGK98_06570 [Arthrobacter sp.]|jgi:hypothetical protein|uniref:hypothetical protein n=1 Tax=Arthrobacter sp. TaxID=1667 RepID=UPI002F42C1CE